MVDRTGEHHLWLGAKRPDLGTGRVRIGGKELAAHRVAWERAKGPLRVGRVLPCAVEPACVRLEHLQLVDGEIDSVGGDGSEVAAPAVAALRTVRGRKGAGTMREVAPDIWELGVTAGCYPDGKPRRVYRRVEAADATAAAGELAAFVVEIRGGPPPPTRELRRLTMDEAVELFLIQYLREEKGREERTVNEYRALHQRWFSPELGRRRLRDIDEEDLDKVFGMMQKAGLSHSRMNHAKALYAPSTRRSN